MFEEKFQQGGNVFAPVPQGGDMNRKDIEPIVKILPKPLLFDSLLDFKVGCCDNPDIDIYIAVASQAPDLAVFKNPEQLNLKVHIHFTDFIKEDRTAVGLFEKTYLAGLGIGESSPFMSEQLCFQQVEGERTTVDLNKGFRLSG